ncbi:hypothetical protein BpHYR1_006142 [Brachionus plicatilis]|uniref:Uncharacterized protein n=1 Tax=Brachionus plicatilis TaxID=10195 RepID=A0A3M7RVZ1_BRAPC|nr:hypothetical protein BpHYR1_006142 [Brachionus plicatilis]
MTPFSVLREIDSEKRVQTKAYLPFGRSLSSILPVINVQQIYFNNHNFNSSKKQEFLFNYYLYFTIPILPALQITSLVKNEFLQIDLLNQLKELMNIEVLFPENNMYQMKYTCYV